MLFIFILTKRSTLGEQGLVAGEKDAATLQLSSGKCQAFCNPRAGLSELLPEKGSQGWSWLKIFNKDVVES